MYSVFLKDPGQASVLYYPHSIYKKPLSIHFLPGSEDLPAPLFFSAPDPVPVSAFQGSSVLPIFEIHFVYFYVHHQIAACEDQICRVHPAFHKVHPS